MMRLLARSAKAPTPSNTDQVIACIGPTGSGKSQFIDVVAGTDWSGTSLKSVSQTVRSVRVRNPSTGDNSLVLVDTPGFDDSTSDMEVLRMISDWLKTTYTERMTLSGILYFHRITDNRISGTPHRNLGKFGELCGENAATKVIFITTMWDEMGNPRSKSRAETREKELRDRSWNLMIDLGATTQRFNNSQSKAQEILRGILRKPSAATSRPRGDGADLREQLKERQATEAERLRIQKLLSQQKEEIERVREQAKESRLKAEAELDGELRRMKGLLDKTIDGIGPIRHNIVVFGGPSVGKSSVINMLAGEDVAPTLKTIASSGQADSYQCQSYDIDLDEQPFRVHEASGFDEDGRLPTHEDIARAYSLIKNLGAGVSLLVFCMRAPRMTEGCKRNWRLFHEVFCKKKVAALAVVTGLENEDDMDAWWNVNETVFHKNEMFPDRHACVTAIKGRLNGGTYVFQKEFDDSQKKIRGLIKSSRMETPWSMAHMEWFNSFVVDLVDVKIFGWRIGQRKVVKKVKGAVNDLVARCGMSKEDAKNLAETLDQLSKESN